MPLAVIRERLYHKPALQRRTLTTAGIIFAVVMVLYVLDGLLIVVFH
jgi:hypothetical protein